MEHKRNLIKYTGSLTREKPKKGGETQISWRAVAAINLVEMAVKYRDSILEEESVIEGTCEEVK